jgi:hypothetical protein
MTKRWARFAYFRPRKAALQVATSPLPMLVAQVGCAGALARLIPILTSSRADPEPVAAGGASGDVRISCRRRTFAVHPTRRCLVVNGLVSRRCLVAAAVTA